MRTPLDVAYHNLQVALELVRKSEVDPACRMLRRRTLMATISALTSVIEAQGSPHDRSEAASFVRAVAEGLESRCSEPREPGRRELSMG